MCFFRHVAGISPHLGTPKTFQLSFLRFFVEAVGLELFVITCSGLCRVELKHRSVPLLRGDGLDGGWSHFREKA